MTQPESSNSSEPAVVIVARVATGASLSVPAPDGSIQKPCGECGEMTWVSPVTQKLARERPVALRCDVCMSPSRMAEHAKPIQAVPGAAEAMEHEFGPGWGKLAEETVAALEARRRRRQN
jgi:hypothetical protein